MRTNSGMTKKSVRKFAVLLALVLCFAVAFGVTMAIGTNGSMDGAILNNVAQAWSSDQVDSALSYGSAGAIDLGSLPSDRGGLSAVNLFKGGSSTSTSWSDNVNLSKIALVGSDAGGPTNVQIYKNGGDTRLFIESDTSSSPNIWKAGVMSSYAAAEFSLSMNFALPASIVALVNNSNFTVKAKITYVYYSERWISNHIYSDFQGCSASSLPNAQHYCQKPNMEHATSQKVDYQTKQITLASGQDCVSFGLAYGIKRGSDAFTTSTDKWAQFQIKSMTFDVSLNSFSDNNSLIINDGSAPVKVGELFKDNYDGHYSFTQANRGENVNDGGMGRDSANNLFSTFGARAKQGSRILEEYYPYIFDRSNMPVYYSGIVDSQLNQYMDKRMDDTSVALNSFISKSQTGPNGAYRKHAKILFADTFNYAGVSSSDKFNPQNVPSDYMKYAGIPGFAYVNNWWAPSSDDDRALKMVSGIKTVYVSVVPTGFDAEWEYTFNVYSISGNTGREIGIKQPNGDSCGYIRIVKNNRASVMVEVYMNCNATVTIQVKDFGGTKNADGTIENNESCTSVTQFSGIDYEAPTADVADGSTSLVLDGFIANDKNAILSLNLNWYKRNLFESEMTSGEDLNEGTAPHIWFYTVRKANTEEDLKNTSFAPWQFSSGYDYSIVSNAGIKSSGILPIGYGALTSFTYDFNKGCALVSGVASQPYEAYNISSLGSQTGAGYYMFTFYKCDLAGNYGEVVTQYVKVDYEKPDYNTEFTYAIDSNTQSDLLDIYASIDKVDWALGEATLKIIVPQVNLSGNTFRFEDADREYILTIDRNGNFALFNDREKIGSGNSGDKLTLKIATYIESTEVYFEYRAYDDNYNGTSRRKGEITITFQGQDPSNNNRFPTVAWMTGFNLSTVAYADMNAMDNDESQLFADAKAEAKIFIDRHDPDKPLLQDDDSYLNENSNYTLADGAKWKTDNYNLDATLMFEDFVADIDIFAQYITVYSGFVNVKSLAEFTQLQGKFDEVYKNIKTTEQAIQNGFNRLYIRNMAQLSNSSSPYPIEFFANNGSGMRILYTWVVDQAGRVSQLYSCYVLIDISNYSVSSSMLEAIIGENNYGANGKIAFTNENDVAVTNFKRGQSVKFTVELEEGYVPYRFSNGEDENLRYLLENLSANKTMLKTGELDEFITFEVVDEDSYVITFKIDDNSNFGALESNLKFSMSARKVVTKTPSYNKYYNALKLDMREYVVLDDEDALQYLEFNYYYADSNGNGGFTMGEKFADGDSPLNVGTYFVEIFMPTENVAFVLRPTANEAATGRIEPIQFIILKGLVTITPNVTTSMYGAGITLTYTVDGFVAENATGEELVGSLKLDNSNWGTPNYMFNVGSYAIVQNQTFRVLNHLQEESPNYDVRFVSNVYHTVTQRVVEINVYQDGKQFGEVDPATRFTVDPAQFDWYTGNVETLLNTIFAGYKAPAKEGSLYLYDSNGRIKRLPGETKGNYRYTAPDSSAFDVDSNFTVSLTVDNDCVFTISPRQIAINANGQSTVIKFGQKNDIENIIKSITVGYTIESKDMLYADVIAQAVNGLLALTAKDGYSLAGYDWVYTYDVTLGENNTVTAEDGNIIITLSGEQIYRIYVGEQGAIVIKLKDGAKIEFVFGQQVNNNFLSYEVIKEMFDIEYDDESVNNFNGVKWDYSITGFENGAYLPVGTYNVSIGNVQLLNNGSAVDGKVVVQSFTIAVNPATIVVRPTYASSTNATKVYGAPESVFNILFAIQSVNGSAFGPSNTYAGLTYNQILAQITGAYARGRYAENGAFRAMGAQYDDTTDANGNVLGGEEGDYYGFTVSTAFRYADSNFVIETNLREDVHFRINPKTIDLNVSDFVGINKAYDKTASVNFGSTVAYDIAKLLARYTDDVKLAFDAVYNTIGEPTKRTEAGIIFTNLHLEGAQAHNYVLGNISNTDRNVANGNTLSDGTTELYETAVTDKVVVTIYYIDNSISINNRIHIYINMGAIAIRKSDFTVEKVYDGTNKILKQDVTIGYREDEDLGGSTMVSQLWGQDSSSLTMDTDLQSANAGKYITNIVLRFDMPGIQKDDVSIANGKDPNYIDPDITIDVIEGSGISIRINNISAIIKQKVFDEKSFSKITPVDQDYRGQNNKVIETTESVLEQGQVVDGDVIDVNLVTLIADDNCDAGVHTVVFAEVGAYGNSDKTAVNNPNYTVDVDALNKFYSGDNALRVTINKAKLRPNINFVGRAYDGQTNVETAKTNSDYQGEFVTERFTAELREELNKIHFNNGTSDSDVKYLLSNNGVADANVVTDANGNVVMHNVLVQNMRINVSGDVEGKPSILRNYELSGGRYNAKTGQYVTVDATKGDIDDYEILGAVRIDRKDIRLMSTNVIIQNKVYDRDNKASVTITLDAESGVVNDDAEYLSVTATGTFEKYTAGENIPVRIGNVRFVAKDGKEYLLNNYNLPNFSERRTASILPRPVSVELNLGEKTYNGDTQISNRDIQFILGSMIDNEKAGYAVQTLPGYSHYVDKNVNTENNGIKAGAVLNPILRNSRGVVNYQLAIYSATKLEGKEYFAYVDINDVVYYGNSVADGVTVKGYYYALPTTTKYLENTEANKENIATARNAGAILGEILYNNASVYVINPELYTGDGLKDMDTPVTYVKGEGKIVPKTISISAGSITILTGHEWILTKMYDGTTHCFGEFNKDYEYTRGGIIGVVGNDDVYVVSVTAEFENATTNANYIRFTPTGIEGKDVANYRIDGTIGYAQIRGSITKRPIDAKLGNDTMEYGTAINSVVGNITYQAHGNNGDKYDLTAWEGNLYIKYTDYTKMMGFELGNYEKPLLSRMYVANWTNNVFQGFDKVTSIDESQKENYYIQLSGITSLPKAKATFSVSKPSAGVVSNTYTVTRVNINNYEFTPVYEEGGSKLTVVAKDLFVTALDKNYTKYYAGNEPGVELIFLDKNGNHGFAPSENAYNVFIKNGKSYAPVVKWGILNTLNTEQLEWTELTDEEYKYAKYSKDLPEGHVYMARFFLPTLGADEEYSDYVPNYNLILGDGFVMEGETIKLTYGGYSLKTTASQLNILQPTMGGVSLRGSDNNTFNYTYDGTDHVSKVVIGARPGDTITFGEGQQAIDAGIYKGQISVTRPIRVDNNDTNDYCNIWTSDGVVTINVAKASPELKAVTTSKYYDGTPFVYKAVGGDNMISYVGGNKVHVLEDYVDITYEILKGDEYEPVKEMLNAGTYRVTVKFNEKFVKYNKNYVAETAVAEYKILKSIVTVSISAEGYTEATGSKLANKTLVTNYDSDREKYDIKYSITNMASAPQGIHLSIDQTELVFEKEITSSGRYPFAVKLKDGALDINNYRLVNETGVLELTTKSVASANASVSVDKDIVANILVARELTQGKGNGTDIEIWSKVNAHMPYIDKNAKLASIVRLGLYCDNVLVEYTEGDINVSVAIPSAVGDLEGKAVYTVTPEGGLKRLDNYTVKDGRIEYTTDYLGALVFVDFKADTLPVWQIVLIALAVVLFVVAVVWTTVAYIIRKSKLKKLA